MRISSRSLMLALDADLEGFVPSCETQRFAIDQLRANLTKKCYDSRSRDASSKAVEKLFSREYVNFWLNSQTFDTSELGDAKFFLWKYLDGSRFISFEELASYMPLSGPGKNVGIESTSQWIKLFNSKGTVSSQHAYRFFLDLVSECTLLAAAEQHRCQEYGAPDISPSKLTTVPKTNEIDRTICIEPSVNSFLQQLVRLALEKRLRDFGIDVATQPRVNRHLAMLGSLGHGFATIDLQAASDSITRSFVQAMFPEYLYDLFRTVSSDSYAYKSEVRSFELLCSMGNAITFPLQTLIFSAIVKQAYSNLGLPFSAGKSFSVFGDDIVVVQSAYHEVVRLLELAGFVVNIDKSFYSGEFRESCGADWYNGLNVRAVYARDLNDKHSITALYNQLRSWCIRHGVLLHHVIDLVRPFCFRNRVPMHAPIDSGTRTYSPYGRFNGQTWSFDYAFFTKVQKKRRVRGTDPRAIAGHLAGYCSNGRYSQRERRSRSLRQPGTTSCWSAVDPGDVTLEGMGHEHLKLYDVLS